MEFYYGNVSVHQGSFVFGDSASSSPPLLGLCCEVPAVYSPADVCRFFASDMKSVKHMRVLMNREGGEASLYLIFIELEAEDAPAFVEAFDGGLYNSLEEHRCKLKVVVAIEPAFHQIFPASQCPVCLERFSDSSEARWTTMCGHSFHTSCITQWQDSSCPVCRFAPFDTQAARCELCGASDPLLMCLICGVVGCTTDGCGHSALHFKASSHSYAVELETQRVWDYVGGGYVHRLLQNKVDGKLVEMSDPMETSQERSQTAPLTDAVANAALSEKIRAVSAEYTSLLNVQLETQRSYYERQVQELEKTRDAIVESLAVSRARSLMGRQERQSRLSELTNECRSVDKECVAYFLEDVTCCRIGAVEQLIKDVDEETTFLQELNQYTDESGGAKVMSELRAVQEKDRAEAEAEVAALELQLQGLMEQLEGVAPS